MINAANSLLNGDVLGSSASIRLVSMSSNAQCSAVMGSGRIYAQFRQRSTSVAAATATSSKLTVYRRGTGRLAQAQAVCQSVALGTQRLYRFDAAGQAGASASSKLHGIKRMASAAANAQAQAQSVLKSAGRLSHFSASGECSASGSAYVTVRGRLSLSLIGTATVVSVVPQLRAMRRLKSRHADASVKSFATISVQRKAAFNGAGKAYAAANSKLSKQSLVGLSSHASFALAASYGSKVIRLRSMQSAGQASAAAPRSILRASKFKSLSGKLYSQCRSVSSTSRLRVAHFYPASDDRTMSIVSEARLMNCSGV